MLTSRSFLLSAIFLFTANAYASEHFVIAPKCLSSQLATKPLASFQNLAFIKTDASGIEKLMTLKQKLHCGGFNDVTQEWNKHPKHAQIFLTQFASTKSLAQKKYRIQYSKDVDNLIKKINPQAMWEKLTTLTAFNDRYANSDDGVKAAKWLKKTVLGYATDAGRTDVKAYFVKTGNQYKQPSLVVKIGDSDAPGIVISAHMDTVPGTYSPRPGADDDGSGSATVLEAARTVISSNMHFQKPVYFIWYAAEEEGLVGSYYVVKDFQNKNIPVDAVLHYDLTGYAHQNEPTMYLITDNVDDSLTNYLGELIKNYVNRDVKRTACGYACSDHATWTYNGYAASIAAESAYEDTNPYIHSGQDTMDKLSLEHMTDYTKLAVAFTVELAEPAK